MDSTNSTTPRLSSVPNTLRIPLTMRALGGTLYPDLELDDRYAAAALKYLGDDGQLWLKDRKSVYGTLMRIRCLREMAERFLQQHPEGEVFNLGCGLADYLQWLDNGRMRMIDADLPEVMTIRQHLMPPRHDRHRLATFDLTDPDWWDKLGMPASRDADPVCIIIEGVVIYLEPKQMDAILKTFGERAPAGSVLGFDAMCWLLVGKASHHESVKHTDAEFHWGPRKSTDLTRPHPRLKLLNEQQVMEGYSLPFRLIQPLFRWLAGVPFYAVYTLGVSE